MISDRPAVQLGDSFLCGLLEQLDAILLDAHALTDGLSAEQLNWQPEEGRWSIAQCLDHLTRTVRLYPEQIERMIAEARARPTARPFREGWISRWVVSGMEPPPRMRVRTSGRVDPPADLDAAAVVRDFNAAHQRLRDLIIAADGAPLGNARMRSPFAPILRFTLRQVLAMNLAHARRHLWQARQVPQHGNFPG
jgi:hypothetical protein